VALLFDNRFLDADQAKRAAKKIPKAKNKPFDTVNSDISKY